MHKTVILAFALSCASPTSGIADEPHTKHTKPGHHAHTQPSGKHDATARHRFDDVERWTAVFDKPARLAWQKPAELVTALGVRPGDRVADVGAGTGYLERYLSVAVGQEGTVYAVDVEPTLIEHLRKRAEDEATSNVVPTLASFDNPRLPYHGIDLVLLVDTYHHIDDRLHYFENLKTRLAAGGRLAVVDFEKRELPVGPPTDHKLAKSHVIAELQQIGYHLEGDLDDVLPYQYVLVFRPRR